MNDSPQIILSKPSVQSLLIELFFNDQLLSSATAFLVETKNNSYALLTNRHNFTGKDPNTGKCLSETGGIPNQIEIFHNVKNKLGNWISCKQPLYKNLENLSEPLWFEHPFLREKADVVALPLALNDQFEYYPYELDGGPQISVQPTDIVSVIGFPFGLTEGGYLGIWATGFVASEPTVNFQELPVFLIDCRSRQGQSGSPVIAHRNGGTVVMEGGNSAIFGGPVTRFLGIYSGRINSDSDLGIVWKVEVIRDIVNGLS